MRYEDIKEILINLTDPVLKLEMVMDLGREIKPIPDSAVCTEIKGCASFVKICRENDNFYGWADSELVRGILAIVLSMVDGVSPEQMKKMDLHNEFASLNLNLGAARINGVNSMMGFLQNL